MRSSDETNIGEGVLERLELRSALKRPRFEDISEEGYASPEIKDTPRKLPALPAISVDACDDQPSNVTWIHDALKAISDFGPPAIYPNTSHGKTQSNTSPGQTIGGDNLCEGPFIEKSLDRTQALEMLLLE